MATTFRHGIAACLLVPFILINTTMTTKGAGRHPNITPEEVKKSLDENGSAWLTKIKATGHPRLIYNNSERTEAKSRLLASINTPEVKALLTASRGTSKWLPKPYITPEEWVKTRGGTIFDAKQQLWQRDVGNAITMLCIAILVEPSDELKKNLHDAVIESCKYPTWGQSGCMDLACAHLARGIALAWDWYQELWTPQDRELILKTMTERIGQLYQDFYGKGFWGNGYEDNHNHVDCNGLAWSGLAFYTDIPQAPEWLAAARLNFQKVAQYFPEDGSSAEGVPYWSYGITYILQYIEGTKTTIDSASLYKAPFLQNAINFRLNASTCGLTGTLPWGDAPSRDYYGPHQILNRLSNEYKDPVGSWLSRNLPWKLKDSDDDLLAWVALWQIPEKVESPLLPLDYHLPVADLVMTRSGWGAGDYLLAIKSGFNNRNHSHLSAGAIALAFGSEWLLTTPGYGKGHGNKDYWDSNLKRWNFFANASESHCLMQINGKNQRFDYESRGTVDEFISSPSQSWTGIDLKEAYPDVSSARRDILHRRGEYVLVFDTATSKDKDPLTAEWLAQLPGTPESSGNAITIKSQGTASLRIEALSPALPFADRKPTAPIIDVDKIHTYAVKTSGTQVNFITLIQPAFSGPLPPLRAKIAEQKDALTHLALQGENWMDHIYQSYESRTLIVGSKTKDPSSSAEVMAKTVSVRIQDGSITSLLTVDATNIKTSGIEIKTTSPTNIGIQQISKSSWIVDADQNIKNSITLPDKFTLLPIKEDSKTNRYFIAKSGTKLKEAIDWITEQIQFREANPLSVKALAPQPSLSSSITIPIEAESFRQQNSRSATVTEGRIGAKGGRSIRGFGNDSPEHSMSWEFEASEAGQYQLTLRYATKVAEGGTIAILIDGVVPSQDLLKFSTPETGGWSISEDNWKDILVTDAKGKPFTFNLAKGKHTLTLTKATAQLSLDYMEFKGSGK